MNEREQVEAAKQCPDCDGRGTEADYVGLEMRCVEVECSTCGGTGRLPAPVSQPVAAQGKSGDGLPPLDKESELLVLKHGYFTYSSVRAFREAAEAKLEFKESEIERLKGLLRECGQSPYLYLHLQKRIQAAVTGE